ncbi:hypothetical protein YC2023_103942 [Brassica napus]
MEAQHLHAKPQAEGEWSTGFCDCFSDCKNSCGTAGALYTLISCFTGCGCIYSCFYRGKMRAQYNIGGNDCGDCLKHFFCELCALTQQYRELKNRGFNMDLGWSGNVQRQQNQGVAMATTQQYVRGMTAESEV